MPEQITKPWYVSKTLWANAMAIIAIAVQAGTGFFIPVEIQGALLAVVNFILRIITNSEIKW